MLASAQCPAFFDSSDDFSDEPLWKNCTAGDYVLNIVADVDLGRYTIDWGDGTNENGTGLAAGQSIFHNYPAGIANYTITITANGCTITGLLVSELPVKASIQVPPGGVTMVCAPGSIDFVNSSTGNSPNTTYFWEFGDGETLGVLDASNAGETITHTYQRGNVTCNTRVRLIATNFCSTRPSEATFEPVQIWDLDDPEITASNDLLCYPDTIVTFNNTTYRNCSQPDEGNTSQRFEYWRFIDYFGPGQDSIIDWRPWPPSPARTVAYPGVGKYRVELRDSSFCGVVSITKEIEIIDPPIAMIAADKDTVCLGEDVIITNLTGNPANRFRYNADDGNGWRNFGNNANRTISYNAPGVKTIRLAVDVANATNSCKDTAEVEVVVLPNPTADFTFPIARACDMLTVAFTNQSTDAASYLWDFGNGNSSTSATPPNQLYNQPGKYYITLEVRSAKNCPDTKLDSVEILASPVVNFNVPDTCASSDIRFNNNTVQDNMDPVQNWLWDFGDGTTSTAENPNHLYLSSGTFIVQLTANAALCSAQKQKSVTIFPLPNASFTADPVIGCAPFDVDFTNNSSGAVTYFWDFGDGTTSQDVNVTHEFFNSTLSPKDVDVQLKAISNRGCIDSTSNIVVVNPEISADFNFNATNNCTDFTVQFQDQSQGATSYLWDFGDGTSSTAQNPSHVYTNSGAFSNTVTITFTVSNDQGCTANITKNISIAPDANFGFTASPDSGCTPLNVTFTAKTGAASYDWLFPDGSTASGVVVNKTFVNNLSANANFKVRLTARTAAGCTDVDEQDIVVFPKPTSQFSVNPSSGCSPLEVDFINNSINAATAQWLFGDGQGLDTNVVNVKHTYVNTSGGTVNFDAQLLIESNFGCKDTSTLPVQVFSGISAQINQGLAGCSPFVQLFEASGGDTYEWDFGNGQTSTNASESITYFNSSTSNSNFYNVELVAKSVSGCIDTVRGMVEVYPNPQASFTVDNNAGCSPLKVNFTNNSVGANTFNWNVNGISFQKTMAPFDTTLSNTSQAPTVVNALLQVQTDMGCTAQFDRDITIYPEVDAFFVHDSVACSPFSVPFFNLSTNANSFQWDFGVLGLRNEENPRVTFTNSMPDTAFYPFTLLATSSFGCTDVASGRVKVLPSPIADFNLSTQASCEPVDVTFTNTSQAADEYAWNFGSGNLEIINTPSFQRSFENPNSFVVKRDILLIAKNTGGCVDSMVQVLNLFPRIVANFNPPNSGCSPLQLSINNASQGFSITRWNFNNEQIYSSTNATHTFINSTASDEQKSIELIVENSFGCKDSISYNVDVYATPKPSFNILPTAQKRFPDARFSFDNTTQGDSWQYQWRFGDGTQSTVKSPVDKNYQTWGKYKVDLIASDNECKDSTFAFVDIIPPFPSALFTGGGEDCAPAQIAFSDGSDYAISWLWDFGDGTTSTQQNPLHRYEEVGVYTVTLQVTGPNGENDSYTLQEVVTVNPNANASFTFSPERAHLKSDPIDFVNLSLNADIFNWDFGDGQSSTEENPTHFYDLVGVYTVQLIADNQFSCPDTAVFTNAVDVFSGGIIDFPNAFTPSEAAQNASGVYNPNSIDNDIFFPVHKEVKDYNLKIFSRWGELIFESNDINIGWNGTINGKPAQQDVYVFKVKGIFEDNTTFEKVGDLTLLR